MARVEPPALGPKIQGLRKRRRLTLDELAAASGVSRSMLSQVERGQANPTFATLWALTSALGVEIGELTGGAPGGGRTGIEILSSNFTPEIRTEDGGCVLRILSPPGSVGVFEWYQLILAARGVLSSEAHAAGSMEHLTVLDGEVEVLSGEDRAVVGAGGTARYPADRRHVIRNTAAGPTSALLVVQTP